MMKMVNITPIIKDIQESLRKYHNEDDVGLLAIIKAHRKSQELSARLSNKGFLNELFKVYAELNEGHGGFYWSDFEDAILDLIPSSNNLLALEIDDLRNLGGDEFKEKVLKLIKKELYP